MAIRLFGRRAFNVVAQLNLDTLPCAFLCGICAHSKAGMSQKSRFEACNLLSLMLWHLDIPWFDPGFRHFASWKQIGSASFSNINFQNESAIETKLSICVWCMSTKLENTSPLWGSNPQQAYEAHALPTGLRRPGRVDALRCFKGSQKHRLTSILPEPL